MISRVATQFSVGDSLMILARLFKLFVFWNCGPPSEPSRAHLQKFYTKMCFFLRWTLIQCNEMHLKPEGKRHWRIEILRALRGLCRVNLSSKTLNLHWDLALQTSAPPLLLIDLRACCSSRVLNFPLQLDISVVLSKDRLLLLLLLLFCDEPIRVAALFEEPFLSVSGQQRPAAASKPHAFDQQQRCK